MPCAADAVAGVEDDAATHGAAMKWSPAGADDGRAAGGGAARGPPWAGAAVREGGASSPRVWGSMVDANQ